MRQPKYVHPTLHPWMQNNINPYLYETITETFDLWLDHYNGNPTNINSYILSFENKLDDEMGPTATTLYFDVINKTRTILREYGIVPNEENINGVLPTYNGILSALLDMDGYEDVLRLNDIIQQSTSIRDTFAELVEVVNPAVKSDMVLEVVEEVTDGFLSRLNKAILPRVQLAQKQMNDEQSRKIAKLNSITVKILENNTLGVLQSGKPYIGALGTLFQYYFESDSPETELPNTEAYIDKIFSKLSESIDIINIIDCAKVLSCVIYGCERLFGAIDKRTYLLSVNPNSTIVSPQDRLFFMKECDKYIGGLYHG